MKDLSRHSGLHRQRNRRLVQSVLLALLADVGLIVIELAIGLNPVADMAQRPLVYVYFLIVTLLAFAIFGAMVGSREDLLAAMALQDSLTGLFNARYLKIRMEEELAASRRHGTPLSYVLFDIDHFKKVNDRHGHPVGDQVLVRVTRVMKSNLREGELVARLGGEEFALLLPRTSASEALVGAERIREAIARTAVEVGAGDKIAVTVSAGVACTADHGALGAETLYRLADRALYLAKEGGRNRAVVASKGMEA